MSFLTPCYVYGLLFFHEPGFTMSKSDSYAKLSRDCRGPALCIAEFASLFRDFFDSVADLQLKLTSPRTFHC